ncbi:protein of unknown function [Novosphingobium sp. CF614]|uniref:DUF4166 domain-containing protein n=1 Tax=Novosphingobium sp. CF614 TaxID=1884364 RepID=UPI0008E4104B|nr:DUF4166 domain-containing protein [Novosphingobium sp. CF614]SFG38586.1 protein of unknown function [Novosphingobium sp. CF614]
MNLPLFRRLLGQDIEALAPTLRQAHDATETQRWTGTAVVTRSRNPIAILLCLMLKLPAPGTNIPVTVVFERRRDGERWRRTFAGRSYHSDFISKSGLIVERMGPTTNIFCLSIKEGKLCFSLIGFRFLGIPLPAWLRPRCPAIEREEAGRFVFDVPVSIPWLGFVIRYTGSMELIDD